MWANHGKRLDLGNICICSILVHMHIGLHAVSLLVRIGFLSCAGRVESKITLVKFHIVSNLFNLI